MGILDFLKKKEEPAIVPATKKADKESANVKNFRVAGTSFSKDVIAQLGTLNPNYALNKRELIRAKLIDQNIYEYTFPVMPAELIFEPDNPHDPNAIKVVTNGIHIGYMKKGNCAQVRNLINGGKIESVNVQISGGNCKSICSLSVDGSDYELEKTNKEFSATVTIVLHE